MNHQESPAEILERLGASPEAAHRLVAIGLEPWVLIPLDHPSPETFVSRKFLDDVRDIDDLIVLHYPAFDPTVLDRLSLSEWSGRQWSKSDFPFFPGPVNRICTLAEAGVHPSIASDLSWRLDGGIEVVELIDRRLSTAVDVEPVRIALEDVEFTISETGVAYNEATEAERALMALSGSPNQAIEVLNIWTAATRQTWPTNFPMFGLRPFDNLITSSNPPGEPNPFRRLVSIWDQTMLRRLRNVAPNVPDWHTAFAEEHPDWARRQ